MTDIPMPPDNRPVAERASLDAALNDGGLRIALASAMWRRDYQPGAEAQIGGFVYEIADRIARIVEEREQGLRKQIVESLRRAAAGRREYAERVPEHKAGETSPNPSLSAMQETLLAEAACYESAALIAQDPHHVMAAVPSWRWTDEEVASLYPPKEAADG